jgi:hypothetical protein
VQRDFSLADGELAWTSFDKALRIFDYSRVQALKDGKIHPTQKPVALFEWVLALRAKKGDLILDCYSGSATTAVACYNRGLDFVCIERDPDYFKSSSKRYEDAKRQPFYNSKAWKDCQKAYKAFRLGICERCGSADGTEVHHKIKLNENNINDVNISLNFNNLELLCKTCHAQHHNRKHGFTRDDVCFNEFGDLVRKPKMHAQQGGLRIDKNF